MNLSTVYRRAFRNATPQPSPAERHGFPCWRFVCTLLRTGHIVTTGTLLGGFIFAQPVTVLLPWLWGSVVTGVLLLTADLRSGAAVLGQVRGLAALIKVVILALIPVFWEARVPLLVMILLIGAVISHMPKRMRHRVLIFPNRFAVDVRGG